MLKITRLAPDDQPSCSSNGCLHAISGVMAVYFKTKVITAVREYIPGLQRNARGVTYNSIILIFFPWVRSLRSLSVCTCPSKLLTINP